jgi:ribosomal protein S18 acetylase RimI-like enzyme
MRDTDVFEVSAALARAFFDDPLQAWMLPDEQTRLDVLRRLFILQSRGAVPSGHCFTDESLSVGAFWLAPNSPAPDARDIPDTGPLRDLLGDGLDRLKLAMAAMRVAHPTAPHWYLEGLGTDPPAQQRGLATAALAPVLTRCDVDQTPAYLESTKESNVGFYERRGFRLTGTIDIPGGGPRLWAMWREPSRR